MTLNGVMAVTLRHSTEYGKPALQKTICGGIYARVYIVFLVRVQRRRKESSRSLSHLMMSFLYHTAAKNTFNCAKMQHINVTSDKVLNTWYMDHLSASPYTRVTDYQIWSDFLWLKLIGIFRVVYFLQMYAKNI